MAKRKCFGHYNGHDTNCVKCNRFDCIVHTSTRQKISVEERIKARIAESAIKVSTVNAPHKYMKAVGTRELERIIEDEFHAGDTEY